MEENTTTITPEVTPVTPENPKIEENNFNPQAFGADIMAQVEAKMPELVEKVSARTREEIINKIVGKNETEEKGPWVPSSYEEIKEKSVEEAIAAFEKKQADAQAKIESDRKTQQETETKTIEANNEYWDKQLGELEKDNVLMALPEELATKLAKGEKLSEEEQNHPSIQQRAELYAKSKELKDNGDADWWNFKYVAYRFGIGRNQQQNAPVMYRNSYSQPSEKSAYSYEDIHNQSFQDIAKGGK